MTEYENLREIMENLPGEPGTVEQQEDDTNREPPELGREITHDG